MKTVHLGHGLDDDSLVCENTSSLARQNADPKQRINLVDEGCTGGEPPSGGEHSSNQLPLRVPPTKAIAMRTVNSLISLLRPIREIFSLCVDLREGTTTEQRKGRSGPSIHPSDQPMRKRMATKDQNRRESQVRPRASVELNQGALSMTDRRNRPLQHRGNRLLMTVCHPTEKEGCQKMTSSTGEWVIHLPRAIYHPSLLPFNLFSLT